MISKNSKLTKKSFIIGLLIIIILGGAGLTVSVINAKSQITKEAFLKSYNLKVKENPTKSNIDVPSSWDVKAGDYPVGLYWQLANEYSKDAGLDLTKLKGTNVEVWKYSLADGLPGLGGQSQFTYPSDVILLVKSDKVVGSWLMFNVETIGPSVKKRYLIDITGFRCDNWIDQKGLFSNLGKNEDLETLQPVDLIKAYFKAINDGDKTRANACLSPDAMVQSLTMNSNFNSNKNILYNTGFNEMNSLTESIIKANPISFSFLDPETPATTINEIGNLTKIEVRVKVDIKFHDNGASSDGIQDRFALMKKYKTGWKLDGLGTGP